MGDFNISGMNRVVGMVSGLDVDALVKNMNLAQQTKIDAFAQKKVLTEWKINAYKEVNNIIAGFVDKYLNNAKPASSIQSPSAFNIKNVVSKGDENLLISAGSNAGDGSYTINQITSLATGANLSSLSGISTDPLKGVLQTVPIKDLNLARSFEFESEIDEEGNEVHFIAFEINGFNFKFKDTDTLRDIFNSVNKSGAGVVMTYSTLSDKITVKSKTLGMSSELTIINYSGNFFAGGAENSALGLSTTGITPGTNAFLKINGYEVIKESNTFTIDGVTYNIFKETNTEINFSIQQRPKETLNKIRDFIDDYNNLIEILGSKLKEEKFKSFPPLTDLQKKEMSEKEIEEWQKKAKSGLLSGDNNLRRLLNELRSAFSNVVEGAGISLGGMGITTGSWTEGGKLYIDEAKLEDAIANHSDKIASLFTKTSSSSPALTKYSESGIATRLSDVLKSYTGYMKTTVLPYSDRQITDYSRKIADAIKKMNEKEDQYYRKFAILESSLAKLNSQSMYFASFFENK